jgi:hypothetical protein
VEPILGGPPDPPGSVPALEPRPSAPITELPPPELRLLPREEEDRDPPTRLMADCIALALREDDCPLAPPLEPPADTVPPEDPPLLAIEAAEVLEDPEPPPWLPEEETPPPAPPPRELNVPDGPPRPKLPRLPRNCGVINEANFSADVVPVSRTIFCTQAVVTGAVLMAAIAD